MKNKKMKKIDFKVDIWKVDFSIRSEKTGEPAITKIDYFEVIGMTDNQSLVIVDHFNKKRWIKKEYWQTLESPIWFETRNKFYGYIFRVWAPENDMTLPLAIVHQFEQNNN